MTTVWIFLKAPTPGMVKTRLATTVGAEAAARMYASWTEAVFRQLAPLRPGVRLVAYFAGDSQQIPGAWRPLADTWIEQPPGTLGDRLAWALTKPSRDPSAKQLAIGTDCLDLNAALIQHAIDQLDTNDVTVGPTSDGGYYLIGVRSNSPSTLFNSIRWSTETTLSDQLLQCERLNLTVGLLPILEDIDTFADWERYERRRAEVQDG